MALTYTDLGYLEADYLVDAYATVIRQGAFPSQFEAVIVSSDNVSSQVEANITQGQSALTQFEAFLTQPQFFSSQFEANLAKDALLRMQVEATIVDSVFASSQFLASLTQPSELFSQFEAFVNDFEQSQSAQVEANLTQVTNLPSQMLSSITSDYRASTQLEGDLRTSSTVGAQLDAQVTQPTTAGTQFEANLSTSETLSNQSTFTSVVEERVGTQFLAFVTQPQRQGSQFDGVITDTTVRAHSEMFVTPILHTLCGEYLMTPYLQDPYLLAKYCAYFRSQFSAVPSGIARARSQFEAVITKDDARQAQFEAVLTKQYELASQFEGVLLNTVEFSSQFEGVITKDDDAGAQFEGVITKDAKAHAQFDAVVSYNLPAQFRSVLYNANNLRILCDFASRGDGSNWTASTQATGDFDVNNVNTDIVEQTWRGANGAKTNVILTCDTGIPQGIFLDTLAVLNHNLTTGAVVFLQGSNDNFTTVEESIRIFVSNENFYYIAPSLPANGYRYFRLTIDDDTNTNDYLEIGTIVFGSSTIFQGECFSNPIRFKRTHFKDEVFTEGFTNVSNDRGLKRRLGLDFRSLDFSGGNYRNLVEIFQTSRTNLKCLWIPTPKYPNRYAVFGKLEQLPEETHTDNGEEANYVDLSVEVDESL